MEEDHLERTTSTVLARVLSLSTVTKIRRTYPFLTSTPTQTLRTKPSG